MSQDSIVNALTTALEEAPDDIGLRLHLAGLHLKNGSPGPAFEHYTAVLAADPAHLEAMAGAGEAAEQLGDLAKATGYRTLLSALGGETKIETISTPDEQSTVTTTKVDSQAPALRVISGGQDNVVKLDIEEPPALSLDDVAGLEEVKRRIDMAFLQPIRNPELTRQYGKKIKGGLLLYGPPGCGKTHIARALAGELRANFIPVGLNDVLDMFVGESEKRLHALFADARQRAPSLIFFDELDALGRKRSEQSVSTRDVVNQLLTELDGINGADDELFVLGATNLPWDVDDALKRPGRFDRSVFVCPPDAVARKRILEITLAERPVQDVNLDDIVKKTKGFSGADVSYLCESATEAAMEDAIRTGKTEPIGKRHFKIALKDARASVGTWFETARNYTKFANASGQFNDLAEYIEKNRL